MTKNEKDKQTNNIVHTTLHRKLKNKQHEPHQNIGVIESAPGGKLHVMNPKTRADPVIFKEERAPTQDKKGVPTIIMSPFKCVNRPKRGF